MSTQINKTKVITGKVRFCYVNVFELVPASDEHPDDLRYKICIVIPKSDTATVDKIKAAINAAIEERKASLTDKNGRIPSNLKTPLRDGDVDKPDDPTFANCYFINATSKMKPGVVDENLDPIMSKDEFYSGCYGRASITFYAYNKNSKGIAAGLNNLQKLEDGEPLSGGSSAAEDFGGDNAMNDDLL